LRTTKVKKRKPIRGQIESETRPPKDRFEATSRKLSGKRVTFCITGSVAAIRAIDIARKLKKHGCEVFPIMSQAAISLIHPNLVEWATGNQPIVQLTGKLEHITLGEKDSTDLVLLCPATANTISKVACGIDDTPVTSVIAVALGSKTPVMIVPAMHTSLYNHPILIENIGKLRKIGVEFVDPTIEEGKAKIADVNDVIRSVEAKIGVKQDMGGLNVLITAGPTVEHLDPVRVLSNMSSGKMGVSLAEEALSRGAKVTLIYGPGKATPPQPEKTLSVKTAKEMHEAVISELKTKRYQLMIAASAVADYVPIERLGKKIQSNKSSILTIKLKRTPKIIDGVKKTSPTTHLIAFKAESRLTEKELIDKSYERLKTADADFIVANDVSRGGSGFGEESNEVLMINRKRLTTKIKIQPKRAVARKIFDVYLNQIEE